MQHLSNETKKMQLICNFAKKCIKYTKKYLPLKSTHIMKRRHFQTRIFLCEVYIIICNKLLLIT